MIFLDFEASALEGGYPIEVGFCVVDAQREMQSASRLIRHDKWLADRLRWSEQAAQVHKISRTEIEANGHSPTAVMAWLNGQLGGMVAVADSPYDTMWLRELAETAGVMPTFGLVDDIAIAFSGPEIFSIADELEVDAVLRRNHRAAVDAEWLAIRYILSMHVPPAAVHRLHLTQAGVGRWPLR